MKPTQAGADVCYRCRGRGRTEEEVATDSVYTPDLLEFMETFAPYHAHGIMPLGPNREDQPATWLEAAGFMETALADYRAADRQEAQAKRDSKPPTAPARR